MISNKELQTLISQAEKLGAKFEVLNDGEALMSEGRIIIKSVRAIGSVPGIGPFPMPPIAAGEALRRFIANGKRQADERRVIRAVVKDAIAAGFELSVYDGEAYPIKRSTDAAAIVAAMCSTDEDRLVYRRSGTIAGEVLFVYGNSGAEVIADYSVALEPFLAGAHAVAEKMEA